MPRLIRERYPQVALMITGTAEANVAMRAINTHLRFFVYREKRQLSDYPRRVGCLDASVGAGRRTALAQWSR